MSVTNTFSRRRPTWSKRFRQARAAAPAPEATSRTSSIFLFATLSALIMAAATVMAVPC
ncbi:hypothetical protein D3C78_1808020 [compost metagenome]